MGSALASGPALRPPVLSGGSSVVIVGGVTPRRCGLSPPPPGSGSYCTLPARPSHFLLSCFVLAQRIGRDGMFAGVFICSSLPVSEVRHRFPSKSPVSLSCELSFHRWCLFPSDRTH